MKKFLLLLAALTLSATQAFACMHSQERFEKIANELNLTKEQRSQIQTLHADAKQKLMPLREQLREIRHRINETFKTNSMNNAKETMFIREQKETIGEMLKIKMHERVEMNRVLTEKQRIKLSDMIQHHKEHKMKKKHHAD